MWTFVPNFQKPPRGFPENSVQDNKKKRGQADNAQTVPLATAVISTQPLGETIFHLGFKLSTSLGHHDSSVIAFSHTPYRLRNFD